jgi:predicted ABC-type ATPase
LRRRPVCRILGGTNGSGKSSLFENLNLPGPFLNADVVARGIDPDNPEGASLAAGRVIVERLRAVIGARQDFTYETTLSSHQAISLMQRAKDAGYEVGLVFVALGSADMNVDRVANRVASGGHNIPEDVIRRRYDVSLARLADAIRVADATLVYDNTAATGPSLLIRINGRRIEINALSPTPKLHVRVAAAVAEALDMSASALLQRATR